MRFSIPTSNSKRVFLSRFSIIDLLWLFSSPFIALGIRGQEFIDFSSFPKIFPPTYEYALLTFLISLPFFLLFKTGEGISYLFSARDVLSLASATLSSVAGSIYIVFFVNRLEGIPRTVPIIYGLLLIVGLTTYRILMRAFYEKKHPLDKNFNYKVQSVSVRRIIIIGVDHFSISAIRLIDSQSPRTIQVVAAFSLNSKHTGKSFAGVKVIGDLSLLAATVREYEVHGVTISEIWVSDTIYANSQYLEENILNEAKKSNIIAKRISKALNLSPAQSKAAQYATELMPAKTVHSSYLKYKRFIDFLVSGALFILLIPVFLIIHLIVLLDVGSPVLFWQQRSGLNGNMFLLYKFRTLDQPFAKDGSILSDKERMSAIGSFLRNSRLDELPQLLSVVVGDMSLIGPRPLLPRDEPKDNHLRLSIRPGITGWGQVNGNDLLTPNERNALDCYYIAHASLLLDISIMLKTTRVLFHGTKRNESAILNAITWYNKLLIFNVISPTK